MTASGKKGKIIRGLLKRSPDSVREYMTYEISAERKKTLNVL
jgi:hypothetical protein